MNRTDRLLAIVLELQAHGMRRAEDLAATFEISRRTVYRDVQALCEAGVPVVAEPGRGYTLPAGYFLPPLRFSADEAMILLLGAEVMAGSFDAEYGQVAQGAARKISGALPAERRAEVEALRAGLHFVESADLSAATAERLRVLRGAVVGRRSIRFAYQARYSADGPGARSEREVDPYGLARVAGIWYLVGYDHGRADLRNFRLDRIEAVVLLARHFERPPNFILALPSDERSLEARVLVNAEAAPWVREQPSFYTSALEEQANGLLITLHMRRFNEVLPWLLSWGRHIEVLDPPALRELLAAEARAILVQHESLLT